MQRGRRPQALHGALQFALLAHDHLDLLRLRLQLVLQLLLLPRHLLRRPRGVTVVLLHQLVTLVKHPLLLLPIITHSRPHRLQLRDLARHLVQLLLVLLAHVLHRRLLLLHLYQLLLAPFDLRHQRVQLL